jgi:hypothetical protein
MEEFEIWLEDKAYKVCKHAINGENVYHIQVESEIVSLSKDADPAVMYRWLALPQKYQQLAASIGAQIEGAGF